MFHLAMFQSFFLPCLQNTLARRCRESTAHCVIMFNNMCLFCQKFRKKKSQVEHKLIRAKTGVHQGIENNIHKYTSWLEDESMLRVISIVHLLEKEAYYHSLCRKHYQNQEESTNVAKAQSISKTKF